MKRRNAHEMQVYLCTCDHVLVVAFAIILFDLQCNSEGIEITVRWTGQRRVSDVCWSWRTPKGRREAVQDTTDLDGRGQEKMVNDGGSFAGKDD